MKRIYSIYWLSAVALLFVISCGTDEKPDPPKKLNTAEILFEYDMLTAIGQMAVESNKDNDLIKIMEMAAEMGKTDTSTNAADLVYSAYMKVKPKRKNLNHYFGTGKPETDTLFNDANTLAFIKNHIRKEFNSMADVILEMLGKYKITNTTKLWIPPKYFKVQFDSPISLDSIKKFSFSAKEPILAFHPVKNTTEVIEHLYKLDKVISGLLQKNMKLKELYDNYFNNTKLKNEENREDFIKRVSRFPITYFLTVHFIQGTNKPVFVSFDNFGFPATGDSSYYSISIHKDFWEFLSEVLIIPEINSLFEGKYKFISSSEKLIAENDGFAELFAVSLEPELTEANLLNASAGVDESNKPIVVLELNAAGAKIFEELTASNINQRIAISVAGRVYSAPIVQSKIIGGSVMITGLTDTDEASRLAAMIYSGINNWPLKIISIK